MQNLIMSLAELFPKKRRCHHLSHEKNPPTFHYTGWLMGILIMAYHNPYMGVSQNNGASKSSILIGLEPLFSPSILGYIPFLETPI